jgi:hypothetical protein
VNRPRVGNLFTRASRDSSVALAGILGFELHSVCFVFNAAECVTFRSYAQLDTLQVLIYRHLRIHEFAEAKCKFIAEFSLPLLRFNVEVESSFCRLVCSSAQMSRVHRIRRAHLFQPPLNARTRHQRPRHGISNFMIRPIFSRDWVPFITPSIFIDAQLPADLGHDWSSVVDKVLGFHQNRFLPLRDEVIVE